MSKQKEREPVPKPVLTKAQAMQTVLRHVEMANKARAQIKETMLMVVAMKKDADKLESATFDYIQELKDLGFSEKFLGDFISECGLCSDGLITKKAVKEPKSKD